MTNQQQPQPQDRNRIRPQKGREASAELASAVKWGSASAARRWIDLGADPQDFDPDTGEAVWMAACGGDEALWALLSEKVDPFRRDAEGRIPLMQAAARGRADCVRWLLPRSDPMARDAHGRTALMLAVGHLDALRALLPGSDPLARDGLGETALIACARLCGELPRTQKQERAEALRCLEALAAEGGAKIANAQGETPLIAAAAAGCADAVGLLAPLSDLNARDNQGRTALMLAAAGGHSKSVAALLEIAGTDIEARDKATLSAMAHARAQGCVACEMEIERARTLRVAAQERASKPLRARSGA
jgi:uncharacterized protein